MTRVSIVGGRLIDPANGTDGRFDLHIADGKVVAVGRAPDGFAADQTVDAQARVVCPGLIDLGARFREPGQEHKATIASESAAAARSGITTLCCPPDTDPVIDTPAVAELIRGKAAQTGMARVLPIGALTKGLKGHELSCMAALKEAGCIGVSNACEPIETPQVERLALEYAATFGLTVFVGPMDHSLLASGCVHEGAVSTRLGLPGIPETAETVAVARVLALMEQSGARVHFCRLSSATAVRMVARAQHDDLPVSADVSAHQLHLTEDAVEDFDSNCHVIPPLRTARDRDGLRRGVADGVITAICSDHQPHEWDAKQAPFPSTAPGISALETLLPLTLEAGADLDLPQAIARLTSGPAQVAGLAQGTLSLGATADVCIFDPDARWQLDPGQMISAGHNTPFAGRELRGRVTHSVFEGRLVYAHQP